MYCMSGTLAAKFGEGFHTPVQLAPAVTPAAINAKTSMVAAPTTAGGLLAIHALTRWRRRTGCVASTPHGEPAVKA